MRAQNLTLTGSLPLDRPAQERPFRLYVATSNHCNRSCPWCCTCSSPRGGTHLQLEAYRAALGAMGEGPFEVQLEGGEPTIHPLFDELVRLCRAEPRCARLVVVTNGVVLPREAQALAAWLARLGEPLTIKLSVNHHLLERDEGLLPLAAALREHMAALGGDRQLVLNVRLRRDQPDGDDWVKRAVEAAGLLSISNVFHLQRYGFARKQADWDEPFLVGDRFAMLNPDGALFGPDLVARSEAMRVLP